jgi:hypothetical protein
MEVDFSLIIITDLYYLTIETSLKIYNSHHPHTSVRLPFNKVLKSSQKHFGRKDETVL